MVAPTYDDLVVIATATSPKVALQDFYAHSARKILQDPNALPFMVPGTFVGCFIVPSLFLAISQKRYPWVAPLRFLVFGVIAAINWDTFMRSTSTNVACGYGNGMVLVWGTMLAAMVLVCIDGQKVERIAKRQKLKTDNSQVEEEYYWQSYPHDGTFGERFLWGFDMVTSLRGAGWSWAISSLPQPPLPSIPRSNELVKMELMPMVSRAGYRRQPDKKSLIVRLSTIALLGYLVLDLLSILVEIDPYAMLGPIGEQAPFEYPPKHLAWIPPYLMHAYKLVFFFTCIFTSLHVVFTWIDLTQIHLFSYLFPLRAETWQYTQIFGPPMAVVDSGLAGLWGVFWHQTFRAPFSAPVRAIWGEGHGTLPGKKAALFIVAFTGSGLMHAGASYTAIPDTNWRDPLNFFLAQGVGVVAQRLISQMLAPLGLPRWLRRTSNVVTSLVWLYFTGMLLGSDFAIGGIWMLEPCPWSPLRALGYGFPGDSAWRWNGGIGGGWFAGKNFWEVGYGI